MTTTRTLSTARLAEIQARDDDVPWTAMLRQLQVADEYVWTALADRHDLLRELAARTNAEPASVRLPGESPCRFSSGDGWCVCEVHGWTGPKSQRSRVLVCPDATTP